MLSTEQINSGTRYMYMIVQHGQYINELETL